MPLPPSPSGWATAAISTFNKHKADRIIAEVNQGDPSVQSVLYQLIQNRGVGEHVLMDNVVIICAGNRDIDRGSTSRWAYPLGNRGTHAELIPDVKPWTAWASQQGISPVVIGFLNFRSELFHTFDADKPQKAFATARTWTFAADDFADPLMPEDVKTAAVAGNVGEGPAIELMGFAEIMASLVPIEQIMRAPDTVPLPDDRLDIQWALATHVSGHMDKSTAGTLHQIGRAHV